MLDIKVLRQEPERIKEALKKRFNPLDIEPAIELESKDENGRLVPEIAALAPEGNHRMGANPPQTAVCF